MREMRLPFILALVFLLLGVWMPGNVTGQESAPWNPDANGDGCVTTSDLVSLLSVFSLCSDWGVVDCPDSPEFTCVDSVDFDNYAYETVLIGDQCWFAENLRTTVYADGSSIPEVINNGEWSQLNTDAYCGWANDPNNVDAYGRLYNWYAVDDVLGLCPTGWHVPTDEEWTELEDFVASQGFDGTEGTALKSTTDWGTSGTDDFGFSALPGGSRSHNNGNFYSIGNRGYWWSSTPNGGSAWRRQLDIGFPYIDRLSVNKRFGFSVRCLKDAE